MQQESLGGWGSFLGLCKCLLLTSFFKCEVGKRVWKMQLTAEILGQDTATQETAALSAFLTKGNYMSFEQMG